MLYGFHVVNDSEMEVRQGCRAWSRGHGGRSDKARLNVLSWSRGNVPKGVALRDDLRVLIEDSTTHHLAPTIFQEIHKQVDISQASE